MFKKKDKKKSPVTTRTESFGSFELRLSDAKVEIEDRSRQHKWVYASTSFEYGLINHLLSQNELQSVEMLITLTAYNQLIWQNESFRQAYFNLVGEHIKNQPLQPETDTDAIEELQTLQSMKDATKGD